MNDRPNLEGLDDDRLRLRAGDIILTRGTGWLASAIRFFTRSWGEPRTIVNHVGLVVGRSDLPKLFADEVFPISVAVVVEAAARVQSVGLADEYGGKHQLVAIARPINLTGSQRLVVCRYAKAQVGRPYGVGKVLLHVLDWCLGGAYVFRRLGRMDDYPICSWLVAEAFARIGKDFGVEVGEASPDDIWDFVTSNPDKYRMVRELAPVKR